MDPSFRHEIYNIAVKTFEISCFMYPVQEQEAEEKQGESIHEGGLRSVIGFRGAAEGEMIIHPSGELLTAMTANMLGIEKPADEQKRSALGEIANIICGNTVPMFASAGDMCYIQPPRLIEGKRADSDAAGDHYTESFRIFLDEGAVEITVTLYNKETQ